MNLKSYDLEKINILLYKYFLFYEENYGFKKEIIKEIFEKYFLNHIFKYEEFEILNNKNIFIENMISKSLFDQEKLLIINGATDKILFLIKDLILNKIDGITIILIANKLEKKSKLRSFFEKEKKLICVPFYPDTTQTLSLLANNFFREKKISISQSNINMIINKCNGDREFLKNELTKIELFLFKKKNLETNELSKLINLIENHSISELIDSCLVNNSKKVSLIINENNFNNEDCLTIIRTFLAKAKKILKLANNYSKNNNLEITLSEARPPIFWKEKDIVKLQLLKWKPEMIKKLISNINNVELEIKKNSSSSLNILMNFIFNLISSKA